MIDVSANQGMINWPAVYAAGQRRAAIRASSGFHVGSDFYIDEFLHVNAQAARAAGFQICFYHYAYPGINSAHDEAQHFWNTVWNLIQPGDIVPFLDFEITRGYYWPPLEDRIAWKATFLGEIDGGIGATFSCDGKARTGFYSYRSECDLMYAHLYPNRPVWLALNGQAPTPFELARCSFLQYGQGLIAGISGYVDLDRVLYPTLPAPTNPIIPVPV